MPEPDLAAEPLDLGAHRLDDADQAEGADVRLGDPGDLLRRAGADELVEHLARQVARIGDLPPELAVGERAGAAFAELDVRFRVEDAAPPQAPGVAGPLAHRRPRSRTIGAKPVWARTSAANRPHGPKPTTTGRGAAPRAESAGAAGDVAIARVGRGPHVRIAAWRASSAASSATSQSTL